MSWFNQNKALWRTAILLLCLISFSGPWGFDSIHVLGENACSDPWFYYTDQLCASTVAGREGLAMIVQEFRGMITDFSQGETILAGLSYLVLLIAIVFYLLAPIFFTLLSLVAGSRRRPNALNLLAWLPTLVYSLFAGVATFVILSIPLWGVWLMVGLAGAAVFLEWRTLVTYPKVQLTG